VGLGLGVGGFQATSLGLEGEAVTGVCAHVRGVGSSSPARPLAARCTRSSFFSRFFSAALRVRSAWPRRSVVGGGKGQYPMQAHYNNATQAQHTRVQAHARRAPRVVRP
jgi:hypothetical protein